MKRIRISVLILCTCFASVAWGQQSTDGNVYALKASNGALLWSFTTDGPVYWSSPAVANGVVYVGSNIYEHQSVYALNASTGALLWSYIPLGDVWSSPAVANGVVYIGSNQRPVGAERQHRHSAVEQVAEKSSV